MAVNVTHKRAPPHPNERPDFARGQAVFCMPARVDLYRLCNETSGVQFSCRWLGGAAVATGIGFAALALSACATGPASTVSTTTTRPTPRAALLVIPSTLAPGIDQVAGSAFP